MRAEAMRLVCCAAAGLLLLFGGCIGGVPPDLEGVTLVFKHGKVVGDPAALTFLLRRFEASHPGVRVREEVLPAATDEQHQFYVINLEGRSADFDVLAMDVIWVPEFIRAGWLRDLSAVLPPSERGAFFAGPIRAVSREGRVFAVPWYIDAGVLYWRKDLLAKYGLEPPRTWFDLIRAARTVTRAEPGLYGFVWQGKQYEGLICDALEFLRSNGGDVLRDGRVVIRSPENREALQLMRDLIHRYGVSPPLVTSATEEPTRHIFGRGKAVFLRNWPYAWNLFQREGSPVRGRVGMGPLPAFPGHAPASTLGGWQLGVNRYSRHPREAEALVAFLCSYEAQKHLSRTVGYRPTRRALYRDPEVLSAQPVLGVLYDIFAAARPRPVTPYYMMISQILQSQFSAVLTGIRGPDAALERAREEIAFVLG